MAVGENVGGSEAAFVERMNAEAQRLGMRDTHYVNPNGLHSPEQYTTARDLALLVRAIRTEFPQYAPYFSIQGLKAGKKTLMSYNLLVGRYDGAEGMKTGFVCASGFNMIGSATRNGHTIAAVVLGEQSSIIRTDVAAQMLDRGFAAPGAGQTLTLGTMPAYGTPDAPPTDMRQEICEKKPAPAQSEDAGADTEQKKSPWLEKIPNPALVKVGLGGATGPVPLMWRDHIDYADVPIPMPRPDYPVKQAAQGDTAAN
jgi:D-alanyl-D-alanine carboxypeptidase